MEIDPVEKSAKRKKIRKNVAKHDTREATASAVATTVEERTGRVEGAIENLSRLVDVLVEPQRGRRQDEEELRRHEEFCNSLSSETGEAYFVALRPEGIWPGFSKLTVGGVDFPMQPPGKHTPMSDHDMIELLPPTGYGFEVELGPLRLEFILERVNRRILKHVGQGVLSVVHKKKCHASPGDLPKPTRGSLLIKDGVLPPRCRWQSDFLILLPAKEAQELKEKGTPPINFPPISVRYLGMTLPPPDVVVEKPPSLAEYKKMKLQLESAIEQSSRPIGSGVGEWWQ